MAPPRYAAPTAVGRLRPTLREHGVPAQRAAYGENARLQASWERVRRGKSPRASSATLSTTRRPTMCSDWRAAVSTSSPASTPSKGCTFLASGARSATTCPPTHGSGTESGGSHEVSGGFDGFSFKAVRAQHESVVPNRGSSTENRVSERSPVGTRWPATRCSHKAAASAALGRLHLRRGLQSTRGRFWLWYGERRRPRVLRRAHACVHLRGARKWFRFRTQYEKLRLARALRRVRLLDGLAVLGVLRVFRFRVPRTRAPAVHGTQFEAPAI